jgi:uncharacterized membrane protein
MKFGILVKNREYKTVLIELKFLGCFFIMFATWIYFAILSQTGILHENPDKASLDIRNLVNM